MKVHSVFSIVLFAGLAACGGGSGAQDAATDTTVMDIVPDAPGDAADATAGDVTQTDGINPGDSLDVAGDLISDLAGETGAQDTAGEAVDTCAVKAPLAEQTAFSLTGLKNEDPEDTSTSGIMESAVVASKGYYHFANGQTGSEVYFKLKDGSEVLAKSALPFNYEIPVAVGQEVWLFARREQGFEHRNLVFVVWDSPIDGTNALPIFFLHDAAKTGDPPWYECKKKKPCPSASQVYTECPPAPVECGAALFPPLELRMHGGLSSGEAVKPLDQGDSIIGFTNHRYMNIHSYHYTDMVCLDLPADWTSAVIGKSVYASQCECHDTADCAAHQICDASRNRCVVDRCSKAFLDDAGLECKEGYVCDPFKGTCAKPFPPPDMCDTDADCGQDRICNRELRFCAGDNDCGQVMGGCVANPCVLMDCAGFCDGLLGICGDCLSDCECAIVGAGDFCGKDWGCHECNVSKIGFGQENPSMFELYYLCAKKGGVDPEIALKQIDSSITCGGNGGPAACDPDGEVGCVGNLEFVPGTKWITDDKYGRICQIAGLDWVLKIAGGHYL